MSENNAVLTRLEDGVLIVSLNRPDIYNALDGDLTEGLIAAIERVRTDDEIGAMVLTGEGKGFCAGGYMKPAPEGFVITSKVVRDGLQGFARNIIKPLAEIEKPIIAAVNGVAAGGGANLALCCDIVFASEKASFIQSYANIGLAPDFAALYYLPHLIGPQKAKDLIFTGRKIKAQEAEELGMVFKVLPHEELVQTAIDYAKKLAQGPRMAIGMSKKLINMCVDYSLEQTLDVESFVNPILNFSADFIEGQRAFNEKRPPVFNKK